MINKIMPLRQAISVSFSAKKKKQENFLNYKLNFGEDKDTFANNSERKVYDNSIHVKNKNITSFRFKEEFVLEKSSAKNLTALKEGSIINCKISEISGNSELTVIDTFAGKILAQGKVLVIDSKQGSTLGFELLSSRKSSVVMKGGVGNNINAWKTAYLYNASVNKVKGLDGVYLDGKSYSDNITSSSKVILTGGSKAGKIKMVLCPEKCQTDASVYLDEGSQDTIVIFSQQRSGTVFMPQSTESKTPPDVKNGEIVYVPDALFKDVVEKNKQEFERPKY